MDPALLAPGALSWIFLVTAAVLLPVAAILQQRKLGAMGGTPGVSREMIYLSAVVTHAGILALALLATREMRVGMFPPYRFEPAHLLFAVGALVLGLIPLLPRLAPRDSTILARTELIAPITTRQRFAFGGVALSAGVVEEIAYRGLLPLLIARWLGGWWIPALLAAIAFGAAHCFQGWRGAILAGAIGMLAQILVGLTGTLLFAIAVHVVHDIVAGMVISRRARQSPGGSPIAIS